MLARVHVLLVVVLALSFATPTFGGDDVVRSGVQPAAGAYLCGSLPDHPWTAALAYAGVAVSAVLIGAADPNHDRSQSLWRGDGELTIAQSCRWDYCCGEWGCWHSCDCW